MKPHTHSLALEKPFSLQLTVESHGWCQLAPWHWDGKRLERSVRIDGNKEWIRVQETSSHYLSIETSSANTASVKALVSRWLHLDWNPDASARENQATHDYLLSLKGIGPYSAAHVMMLMRDFSTVPVDSEVSAYLRKRGLDPKSAQEAFQHWSKYRFLGYKLRRMVDRENWIGS